MTGLRDWSRLWQGRRGVAGAGYGLMVGLVAVIALATVVQLGGMVSEILGGAGARMIGEDPKAETTPDPFSFASVTDVDPSTEVTTTAPAVVTGFEGSLPVALSGGGAPRASVAGGPFESAPNIESGQSLALKVTAPTGFETDRTVTVTIGETSASWMVTTQERPFCARAGDVETIDSVGSGSFDIDSGLADCFIEVELRGGAGGSTSAANGGAGGLLVFDFEPGATGTLDYFIGGGGGRAFGSPSNPPFGGTGGGGFGEFQSDNTSAGGGGASALKWEGALVAVVGGGGGAGGDQNGNNPSTGGAGGAGNQGGVDGAQSPDNGNSGGGEGGANNVGGSGLVVQAGQRSGDGGSSGQDGQDGLHIGQVYPGGTAEPDFLISGGGGGCAFDGGAGGGGYGGGGGFFDAGLAGASNPQASTGPATAAAGSFGQNGANGHLILRFEPGNAPNPVSFEPVVLVDPGARVIASAVTLTGFPGQLIAEVTTGGNPAIIKNGADVGASTNVSDGDTVALSVDAPASFESERITELFVGSAKIEWTVTTKADSSTCTPPPELAGGANWVAPDLGHTANNDLVIPSNAANCLYRITLSGGAGGSFSFGGPPLSAGGNGGEVVFDFQPGAAGTLEAYRGQGGELGVSLNNFADPVLGGGGGGDHFRADGGGGGGASAIRFDDGSSAAVLAIAGGGGAGGGGAITYGISVGGVGGDGGAGNFAGTDDGTGRGKGGGNNVGALGCIQAPGQHAGNGGSNGGDGTDGTLNDTPGGDGVPGFLISGGGGGSAWDGGGGGGGYGGGGGGCSDAGGGGGGGFLVLGLTDPITATVGGGAQGASASAGADGFATVTLSPNN